jgi:4,5-dihydroxyphthalate decarboxylase
VRRGLGVGMALKLAMTCGHYDRAQALIDGTVKPEGIDLEVCVTEDPGRQTKIGDREFDLAEFYSGLYIADLHYKSMGYTAIPIFVKRMFRHSYIYINKRAGIRSPADLNGKRIGIQNWMTTTAVWQRGLLEDEYGLDPKSVTWVAERNRAVGDWKPPAWLKIEFVPNTKQYDLLAAGRIDAGMTTETWAPNVHPDIDFLFPNYAALEREYFKRTGFFPIMHTLLIKTSVLEKNPWVAMSMYNAWQESKNKCYEWLEWQRVHQTSLWYRALWEEEQAVAGSDPYLWGFKKTRPEVAKLLEYCYRQAMTPRQFEPEEMFYPSTLGT